MTTSEAGSRKEFPAHRFRVGPGMLVTAAFIGPGTVVTASKAGAERGCSLLWTVLFACLGTILLQSLAARVGIVSRKGLGESIRETFTGSRWLKPAIGLVIAAIGVGNAAYQTGNLTGAVSGIRLCTGGSQQAWLAAMVACSSVIVLIGNYRILHAILVGLVALLSCVFLWTAVLAFPSADRVVQGMLFPRFETTDLTLVLAMIGTTIVPYNLFLHASSAASTWSETKTPRAISQSDWDTAISVCLGGLVTASVLITASTAFFDTQTAWTSTDSIALQLTPSFGRASVFAFAMGLMAAGLTSSITAPLATAYAVCGCLGWATDPGGRVFRAIALGVIAIGGSFAFGLGKSPSAIIVFAQLANGMLLPIVAIFLLIVAGRNTNQATQLGWIRLLLTRIVVGIVALLGIWRIFSLI